jgi:hypothetical protein
MINTSCWWRRKGSSIGFAGIGVLAAHSASALTVAFWLNNITYSSTNGLYGISTGNGLIAWTYNAGDFQNGTGQYVFVNLPPYTVPPSPIYGPVYTADGSSITGTITQNVDSYSYDFAINYSPALSAPNSTANITSGKYDLWAYNPNFGFNGSFAGNVIGGTVTPYLPSLNCRRTGANVVVTWPTNYADGFRLESASSLNAGGAWTTSSIPLQIAGTNYVSTNSLAAGTNLFFRLIR